jgi:hypothetical protein
MSQNDFDIANQSASSARSDINNALKALASLSSGSSAPSTTYANQFWYETDQNVLRIRNEANTAWLDFMYIDQSTGAVSSGNIGTASENSSTFVGTTALDSDKCHLYWDGSDYKYFKGQLLQNYFNYNPSNETFSSGSLTRQSTSFNCKSNSDAVVFITFDVNYNVNPLTSSGSNEPYIDTELYIDGSKVTHMSWECDGVAGGAAVKSKGVTTRRFRADSWSGAKTVKVVCKYQTGDMEVEITSSSLSIEEYSD